MLLNKFLNNYCAFVFGVILALSVSNVDAYPDMKEKDTQEVSSELDENSKDEKTDPKNLKECKMQAKSKKDAKDCEKKFMKTIDEFIDEEELSSIDGYMKIFTNEDNSEYFLRLDAEDLNSQFLYFSYIMNAPQGSPLTGGLPSDGRVLEFRNFKKDSIGLYQINTNYINGDETNNISKSTITNITEAFVEVFKPSAKTDESVLINVNGILLSEKFCKI